MSLAIVPISLAEANAYVEKHHRHHNPVPGAKFCIAVAARHAIGATVPGGAGYGMHMDGIVGVAIIGRPVARRQDDGWTLEVNRCCTDGTRNACSALYGAAWRATKALGYRRLITYTLPAEGGASLRASGWRCVGERKSGNWNVPSRPRIDTDVLLRGQKLLWEAA